MELRDVRIAILAESEYEDLELWYPYLRFQEAGAEVFIVGSGSSDTYESKHGYPVSVDADADMVFAEQFDVILIPGGWAPDYLRRHSAVLRLVQEADEEGKLVVASCHAGSVLVSARVLAGRRVTGIRAIRDDLVNAGATYVDQPVVRDGNLVTSRSSQDVPLLCREVVSVLQDRRVEPLLAHAGGR